MGHDMVDVVMFHFTMSFVLCEWSLPPYLSSTHINWAMSVPRLVNGD